MTYIGVPQPARPLTSEDIASGVVTLDDINFTDVPSNMDITGTIDKHTMRLADGITVTGDVTISEDLVLAKLSDDGDAITMMNDGTTRTITGSGSIQAATLAATPQPSQTYAVGTTLTGLTGVIGPSVTGGEGLSTTIADNSITLAKMASGTDGQVITYDASGNPVAVGPGTDGQVLTSTGAGSPPAFENVPAATSLAGGSTVAGDLTIESSTLNHPILKVVTNTNDQSGADNPAVFKIGKNQPNNNSSSYKDLGKIEFIGDLDGGSEGVFAKIVGHAHSPKGPMDGGSGKLRFYAYDNGGTVYHTMTIHGERVGIKNDNPGYDLSVSGTVGNSSSTAWTNYSDERIKTNIETIENGLDKLNKLRPVTYNYTEEYLKLHPELSPSKKYNSFIAQEYAEVFPDAVNTGADLEDEDGEVIVEGVKDYTPHDLFMYLVKGVQELSAKNDALEARIKTLEG